MSTELNNALNSRLFAELCDDMGAAHKQHLLHADVRLVSRRKVLARVFKLRNELVEVFLVKKIYLSQLFRDVNWRGQSGLFG